MMDKQLKPGIELEVLSSQEIERWIRVLRTRTAHFKQPDLTLLWDQSGGTDGNTVVAVSGSGQDTQINNNFASVAADVFELRTALTNAGILD